MEELSLLDVSVHEPLAVLPNRPIAPMQTQMIKASMTAYSTAVAPLSSRIICKMQFIVPLLTKQLLRLIARKSLAEQARTMWPAEAPRFCGNLAGIATLRYKTAGSK